MVDEGPPGGVPEEVIEETAQHSQDQIPPPIRRINRRQFAGSAAALLGAAAAAWPFLGDKSLTPKVYHEPTPTEMPPPPKAGGEISSAQELQDHEVVPSFEAPFHSTLANEVAREVGITSGGFFNFEEQTLNQLTAFAGDSRVPGNPPSIEQHGSLISQLSSEFNIPPNVISTIMLIESAGIQPNSTLDTAQGLFQVMPDNFPLSKRQDLEYMNDPVNNGRVAMEYFRDICLPFARDFYADSFPDNPDHVMIYARAMMAYNAGPGQAAYPYYWTEEELQMPMADRPEIIPTQTKKYADFFIQQCLSYEIAEGLRKKGLSDPEIIAAMAKNDIDPRAQILQDFYSRFDNTSFVNYHAGLQLVAAEVPGESPISLLPDDEDTPEIVRITPEDVDTERQKAQSDYRTYDKASYAMPFGPGLRIWANSGGLGMLQKDLNNLNEDIWNNYSVN